MNRTGSSLFVFFLVLVTTASVEGQPSTVALDEILARHVQALGGQDKIDQIHSVIQHLEYREGSFVIPNAFIARMRPYYKTIGDPKDLKVDVNEGYDGSAWEYYGDPGIVLRTVGAAAAAARHGLEIIDCLVDAKMMGTQVQLMGEEAFEGKPAYKLHVILADGFEKDMFLDPVTFLVVGDRRSAKIHAFGEPVLSENQIGDYRAEGGVLFPFRITEIEIATGRELNSSVVRSMEVNKSLDPSFFRPPEFERTPLQRMLEQLYTERTDPISVMWTYHGFRAANPGVDTRNGVEFIGYQMAKMGDFNGAVTLLSANVEDYPKSASAEFGLGRAYKAAGDSQSARQHFQKALTIDPGFKKASDGLNALK